MQIVVLENRLLYDGSQIRPLWAYDMGFETDSIVVWRGPMDVREIKDAEDERAGLAIRGDDLIHIIVERFRSPSSMMEAYLMQRLLIIAAQDILTEIDISTIRDGDDLFADGRKLTVSIASVGVACVKIHLGINLASKGIPEGVDAVGLDDLGVDPEDWMTIGEEIATAFLDEIEDIESDMRKTRTL